MSESHIIDPTSMLMGWIVGKRIAGQRMKPEPPTLAASYTWYKGTTPRNKITTINIVNSYDATGEEVEAWAADVNESGDIMCYVTGTDLTIAGNGSGKIYANEDSSYLFSYTESQKSFKGVTAINGLDLLDTSRVESMERMFQYCNKLTAIDLSTFDTGSVTNMLGMFYCCYYLQAIDAGNFDTSRVTTMAIMFDLCTSLQSLNLSSFDTSSTTEMQGMFLDCRALTSLDLSGFNTSSVTDMAQMFTNCIRLTSLDLRGLSTSSVTDMALMFTNCTNLTSIYVGPDWTTANADTTDMFKGCGVSEVTYV